MTESNPRGVHQVRLIDERRDSFKSLDGFQKHHRVPTTCNDGDQRFLADLAEPELDADLQSMFADLRKSFGLKRKQIAVDGPADGGGVITTPFFQYEIQVELDPESPSHVIWRRSITEISEPARVFAPPFSIVFGNRFSVLEILTQQPLDLESIVDHIEDAELDSVKLDYDKDLSWCLVEMTETKTSIALRQDAIRVSCQHEVSPAELLESFLNVQQAFMSTLEIAEIPFLSAMDRRDD